ncbi:HAAS signaling domain-containing protein [Cellulomonas cellasea]|uniref:Uncharacterized protein n=2 Tax=Cellulomonas cellasea TaxID=43670 RepID=A0A0A0B6K0_9CELL|nr:hypothetical protein [Cellulomonas cellasea]KGM01823.1 hypothetical protein Q760_17145 [Cellulomonas cellasea DSM 20118]GEA89654.1 hypothetical protein CCE01nite_36030 [Cellulomonas cellasea]
MSASTRTRTADVAGYAAAVRRHLAGLSPEQVDDLTDGLEADLADALADQDAHAPGGAGAGVPAHDLVGRFGDPAAYAAELRTSAGLPESGTGAGGLGYALRSPVRALREQRDRALAALRPQPWWGPFEEFARSVTPLAWFARAWVLYQVLRVLLTGQALVWMPRSFGGWVALVALTVVSVQWGRGLWQPGRAGRRVRSVATVVAVLAALPVLASVSAVTERVQVVYESQTVGPAPQDGVVVDGVPVSNLFVYDAEGNPLEDVQVFDDRGRAVRTTFDEGYDEFALPGFTEPWSFLPVVDEDGRERWNVYPLTGAPSTEFEWRDDGERLLPGGGRTPPPPFAKAPSLVLAEGDAIAPRLRDPLDPASTPSGAAVAPSPNGTPTASPAPGPGATTDAGGAEVAGPAQP